MVKPPFQHEMRAAPAWADAYVLGERICLVVKSLQNLSNNNIYQYTQMVNAPAGGQAGAARCCHRAKCLAWRLGYTEVLVR